MNLKHPIAALITIGFALSPVAMGAQSTATTNKPETLPKSSRQSPRQNRAQKNEISRIKIPPLPEFRPQQPKRIVLENGLVVFLQEDHELPIVGGTLRIRGGAREEPAAKTSLVTIYGSVWRTGGTKTRTGDQLDDFLEARAAKLETGGSADSTTIGFNCLKADFDDVFTAFQELLFQPEFREDKIDLVKRQLYGAISRRNDDIDGIAGRESVKLAYGKENPYAREEEYATVAAVTRQDLIDWHGKYTHPNNAIFGVYGDFDPVKMEQVIRHAFEKWQKGTRTEPLAIEFEPAKPGVYFIPKEDVDQSSVQLLTLGIQRNNPDYFAVSALNEILSGGFSSRLITNLRTKAGLAYSVGGGVGSAWDHPGIQGYSIGTKSATTTQAIDGLRKELKDITTDPPKPEELKRAKDSILNSFVFNFDTKQEVLAEKMRYEFYGYPPDFLERYRTAIEKVTLEDVARVAKKYIHPEQLTTLVVGNPNELSDQMKQWGSFTTIDITIPPPPRVPAQPQPSSK
jgi:zinc protease